MDKILLEKLVASLPSNHGSRPEVLTDASPGYDAKRQIFNNKFQFRPFAIVLVETAEQVSATVKFANQHPLEVDLKVRSGGHDHEGECTGTDVLMIDFSKMNAVKVERLDFICGNNAVSYVVSIEPGARFRQIKPILDAYHIGIPHGTCETVAIAGFTLGGGWGPWTRAHGMCCERLFGATLVLGDGEIKVLSLDDPAGSAEAELLWALRGGGGFSYGIVTELRFIPFELPANLCSFNLHCEQEWPGRKTTEIIRCWENAIGGNGDSRLVGTNLKVVAKHLAARDKPNPNAVLACTFNGYFAGTEAEARAMIHRYFDPPGSPGEPLRHLAVQVHRSPETSEAAAVQVPEWHFESWDRHVPSRLQRLETLRQQPDEFHPGIVLEADGPAPHKITSRLADAAGWGEPSREALVCSLQSQWVPSPADLKQDGIPPNHFPIHNYITVGAITGPYYATYDAEKELGSAFPYKNRLFTIQYQVWWDQYLSPDSVPEGGAAARETASLDNRPWVNRAEDWIDACRAYPIPGTSGAFISFKDSAVLTATYFAESYDKLRDIKERRSKDQHLLFRSNKTII